jgi:flagellar protein FliO/FliZ
LRLLALLLLAAVAAGGVAFPQATANPEQLIKIGEDGPAGVTADKPTPIVSTWDFVRMVLILAAVVGAIYVFFYLLRRTSGSARQENDLIRVLAQRTLNGSRSLYLVEVGRSVYLVGGGDTQVSLVAEITDAETLDTLRLAAAENPPATRPRRSFATLLGDVFAPAARSLSPKESLTFLQRQKDRLKRM